jgi:citrate synthase
MAHFANREGLILQIFSNMGNFYHVNPLHPRTTMIKQEKDFLERYTSVAAGNNRIPQSLYEKFNVKRGLRNADGTGVLVGLTEVGEVHGYIMDEGEKVPAHGRLRYRGYDVKDLVNGFQQDKRFGFEETVFLLLFSRLPTETELKTFNETLNILRPLQAGFIEDIILKFPSQGHHESAGPLCSYSPIALMRIPEDLDISNILRQSDRAHRPLPHHGRLRLSSQRSTFHDKKSLYIHAPQLQANPPRKTFLAMVTGGQCLYTPLEAELLDLSLVLHAEHGGGNNSAFSIHLVSSAGTDTYSAIGAAIGSLKGIKHGGANIKVRKMMDDIKKNVKNWDDEDELSGVPRKNPQKRSLRPYGPDLWDGPCGLHPQRSSSGCSTQGERPESWPRKKGWRRSSNSMS